MLRLLTSIKSASLICGCVLIEGQILKYITVNELIKAICPPEEEDDLVDAFLDDIDPFLSFGSDGQITLAEPSLVLNSLMRGFSIQVVTKYKNSPISQLPVRIQ